MMAAPLSAALNAARGQGAAMPPTGLPRGEGRPLAISGRPLRSERRLRLSVRRRDRQAEQGADQHVRGDLVLAHVTPPGQDQGVQAAEVWEPYGTDCGLEREQALLEHGHPLGERAGAARGQRQSLLPGAGHNIGHECRFLRGDLGLADHAADGALAQMQAGGDLARLQAEAAKSAGCDPAGAGNLAAREALHAARPDNKLRRQVECLCDLPNRPVYDPVHGLILSNDTPQFKAH